MNFKEEIKRELKILKDLGISRQQVEKDLNYNDGYLSQAMSRGGNKRLLDAIKLYAEKVDKSSLKSKKTDAWEPPVDDLIEDRVVLKTLLNHVLKIEAVLYNRPLDDVRRDFKLDTNLLLDQLTDGAASKS